jgi:hypothetical protein
MNTTTKLAVAAVLLRSIPAPGAESAPPGPSTAAPAPAGLPFTPEEADRRASRRYEEMLDKMQAAVEEIAQLYGNPVFLQVFTNDPERASELKQRLKAAQTSEAIRLDLAALERKRNDLLNDIALREREVGRVSVRLQRQRAALDAIAAAIEQARKAVEDTSH